MKRKRKRFEIQQKYLLLGLTIFCVILMVLSLFFGNSFRSLKNFTSIFIEPMQKGVNSVGSWVENKVDAFKNYESLESENDKLKDQLANYQDDLKQYQQNTYELERLQALYDLDAQYSDYKKTVARVISKDTGNWFDVFYVNKGTDDGIKVGCNVLFGNGLLGIVTETGKDYAKIRSIIDDTANVSGMILPSEAVCNISGSITNYSDGFIVAENIDKDADIEKGDQVVTSYVSDKYHQGITIGYVSEIKKDPNNLTFTAYITPAVDFSNVQEVLIILELKKTIDE